MKVNIEVQYLCTEQLRGVPYYMINLVESLIKRGQNEYALSFFDYQKERDNRKYINRHLHDTILEKTVVHECNSLSYSKIIKGNELNDSSTYDESSYSEYFGTNYDVYHFPHVHNVPRNVKQPMVVTVHDILPLIPEYAHGWREDSRLQFQNSMKYVSERKDIVLIADSVSTKNDLVNRIGISADRIHVVPLAYNPDLHYVDKDTPVLAQMGINNPYILYLGALDYRKGIETIVAAFEQIKPRYKDLKLVLAGGLTPIFSSVVDELKNSEYVDDIIFTGFVSDDQKRVLLSCAEIFLFPSEYEGFGLPVLEAMACGAPVITTDVSSLPEVGGDAAMYVTPKQPEELAAAIEKMLSSESVRQDYIARGFEQCKKFSWDKTAAMTEEVYKIAYNK